MVISWVSVGSYVLVTALGLTFWRQLKAQHQIIVAAFAVSVLFNTLEIATSTDNHWVNTVWPRFQGGLILAALTTKTTFRVLLTVAPPAITTWLLVWLNGLTPMTEKMVEVTVFLAIAILASKQNNVYLRWALLIYSLPTVVLSPALASLASQGLWDAWIPLFEMVHMGRIAGLGLVGMWLWRSTRPEQLELKLRWR